jgi:hypothetical protein
MKETPDKSAQPKPQVEQAPKPKYEAPQVVPLNDLATGEGGLPTCAPGSSGFCGGGG